MPKIVVCWIFGAFYLADEASGDVKFKGQISLRKAKG